MCVADKSVAGKEEFTRKRIRVNIGVQLPVKETAVVDRVKQDEVSHVRFCLNHVAFLPILLI